MLPFKGIIWNQLGKTLAGGFEAAMQCLPRELRHNMLLGCLKYLDH
jgi:hypothetical protein